MVVSVMVVVVVVVVVVVAAVALVRKVSRSSKAVEAGSFISCFSVDVFIWSVLLSPSGTERLLC